MVFVSCSRSQEAQPGAVGPLQGVGWKKGRSANQPCRLRVLIQREGLVANKLVDVLEDFNNVIWIVCYFCFFGFFSTFFFGIFPAPFLVVLVLFSYVQKHLVLGRRENPFILNWCVYLNKTPYLSSLPSSLCFLLGLFYGALLFLCVFLLTFCFFSVPSKFLATGLFVAI